MIGQFLLIFMSGGSLAAQYVPRERPAGTDGQYAPTVENAQAFECGTIRAALRYRQERIPEAEAASLSETLRVTLLDADVNGRDLRAVDFDNVASLFRSFGWITEMTGTCYDGRLTLDVRGMPLAPFIASLNNEDANDTPELRLRSIRLGPDGVEYISPQRW